jgi:Ribosomal protein L17
MQTVTVVIQES